MKFWRTALVATLVLTVMLSVTGGTIAWFTDEVTSAANVIKSGTLDVEVYYGDGDSADTDNWDNIEDTNEALFNYTLWEPGYVATKGVKIVNAGDLALKYQLKFLPNAQSTGDYKLEDVIDVYVSDEVIDSRDDLTNCVGTLASLMTSTDEDGAVHGELLAGEEGDVVYIALKMQESAGNDYQNLSVGNGFGIELLATQLNSEEDSFGSDYDGEATYPQVVAVYNSDELNAAIAAGAQKIQAGAGTYTLESASNKSVEIVGVGDDTVIELTGTPNMSGSDLTFTNLTVKTESVDYKGIQHNGDIVYNNVTFNGATFLYGDSVTFNDCEFNLTTNYLWTYGAKEVNFNSSTFNTDGKAVLIYNEGTVGSSVVNIDNCTFNATNTAQTGAGDACAAVEIDSSLIPGTYTVNFTGTNKVDEDFVDLYRIKNSGATNVTINEDNGTTVSMKSATPENIGEKIGAAENGDVIALGSGNYIIPDSAKGKTLTFVGNGDTVVATQDDGSYEGCDYSLDGSTVTFEGITINTDSSTYTGYARLNATYKDCTINGTYTLYGDSVFEDCIFNVSGDVYNIWTWGAPNVTFKNCTFNSDGKALLLYGTVDTNLTVNNCVFNDNGGLTDLKAAIEIGNDYSKSYTLTVNNTTVNGYETNDKGINTGTTLWANKNSMGTDKLNVVVDGVDVY